MKIRGVAWIGIVGRNAQTRRFYHQILGLPELDATAAYSYLSVGDMTRLEILDPQTSSSARQRPDAPAIGFLVDDLDESLRELGSAGLAEISDVVEWRSEGEAHRWVYLRDPDGNVVLLVEQRPASAGQRSP